MTYPCCTGNCHQGKDACDCHCSCGDWWITRLGIAGSALIILLIVLEIL